MFLWYKVTFLCVSETEWHLDWNKMVEIHPNLLFLVLCSCRKQAPWREKRGSVGERTTDASSILSLYLCGALIITWHTVLCSEQIPETQQVTTICKGNGAGQKTNSEQGTNKVLLCKCYVWSPGRQHEGRSSHCASLNMSYNTHTGCPQHREYSNGSKDEGKCKNLFNNEEFDGVRKWSTHVSHNGEPQIISCLIFTLN